VGDFTAEIGPDIMQETADESIRSTGTMTDPAHLHLTDRDRDIFLAALEKPPAPNARLLRAALMHAENVCEYPADREDERPGRTD